MPSTKCIIKIDGTTIDEAEDLDLVMPKYNLLEYSSNYSDTTSSLPFYSKDEVNNFGNVIANTNAFKSFKCKAKLIGSTVAAANEILEDARIPVPLKYLSNFWRSLEMPLINCKVKLKFRWTKHCVLVVTANDNTNVNPNRIIFIIKDTKLYVPVVTSSAKENQKLSKALSKGFETSVYWNEYKTKNENKNTTNEYRYFLQSNFGGVNKLFFLVYSNAANDAKSYTPKNIIYPKGIIKNYNFIVNRTNFYKRCQIIGKARVKLTNTQIGKLKFTAKK